MSDLDRLAKSTESQPAPPDTKSGLVKSIGEIIIGPGKDPTAPGTIHSLQLIAFFAWVGLGADGLSSACYGPEEAFKALGEHHFLAIPLALMVILTVSIISASYSQIIGLFPSGGGGYVVASRLLGKWPGLVSGCALVVDYMLTISISVASGIDQIFSFLPDGAASFKLLAMLVVLAALTVLNLRGVKESIKILLPIFLCFLATHAFMIIATLVDRGGQLGDVVHQLRREAGEGGSTLGLFAMTAILLRAFTHGAGTFTGIEAVSNSMQILREPRARTGRRTMLYMAVSLSLTAAGILVGYLLVKAVPQEHKTLNAVLFENALGTSSAARTLIVVALLSAGALLFVAAQSGFIDGPRVLGNMALDAWVPRRFANLSNRLVIADGVALMGITAAVFLLATGGSVELLVVLYSINVFITFALSQLGMCVHWIQDRKSAGRWLHGLTLNGLGFVISFGILAAMVWFKLMQGGWVTLAVTAGVVLFCVLIRRHYDRVKGLVRELNDRLMSMPLGAESHAAVAKDAEAPTAVFLVSGFNGLGIHTILSLHRLYPGHYRNFIFVQVGEVDYDRIRSEDQVRQLYDDAVKSLAKYEPYARALNGYFEPRVAISADISGALEHICLEIVKEFPRAVIFGGQITFRHESMWTRMLHGSVSYDLQRRLHLAGIPMMILPTRL